MIYNLVAFALLATGDYEAIGKRDPFRNPIIDATTTKPTTELETFELDQLKLIAVVTGGASPYAMLEDPNGKGHAVHKNTRVGKRGGRVFMIKMGEVIIRETYLNVRGDRVVFDAKLELKWPVLESGI
jgi:type IV pilus assembly protein PilP